MRLVGASQADRISSCAGTELAMTKLKKLGRTVLPRPLRGFLRAQDRRFVFRRAMCRLLRDPRCLLEREDVLPALSYGWGNTIWSASDEYVLACASHAWECDGPILECGSGLTTIVLGAIARKKGQTVWTLEHNEHWAQRIRRYLRRYRVRSVRLMTHPLLDYGSYCWYAPPLEAMPETFGMVVCDGPPHSTQGGRYGLLPVMGDRLPAGTTILLDDAARAPERSIAARWAAELGTNVTMLGARRRDRYIRITIPETRRATIRAVGATK
jgi:predicted O-methyltransferase YrrM